jgi:hypothetical protein
MASYYTDEGIGQTMQGRLLDSLTHSQDPSQKNETGCRESSIAVLALPEGSGSSWFPSSTVSSQTQDHPYLRPKHCYFED